MDAWNRIVSFWGPAHFQGFGCQFQEGYSIRNHHLEKDPPFPSPSLAQNRFRLHTWQGRHDLQWRGQTWQTRWLLKTLERRMLPILNGFCWWLSFGSFQKLSIHGMSWNFEVAKFLIPMGESAFFSRKLLPHVHFKSRRRIRGELWNFNRLSRRNHPDFREAIPKPW